MRIGIAFSEDVPHDQQQTVARDAEAAGLSSLWTADALSRDPFLVAHAWADATSTLQVGIGVLQVLTRSPIQVAKAAATLQESSAGRLLLGLGASVGNAMRWHGLSFDRPLTAVRDALEIVRAVTRGQVTDHEGDVFSSHGFQLRFTPLPPAPPIYVGATRPRALALVGTHADGVLLSWKSAAAVAQALEVIGEAARGAGRPMPASSAYVRVAIGRDREAARTAMAQQLAFYWQFHGEEFAAQVSEDAATRAQAAFESGGQAALADAADEELLTTLGWYGTSGDDIGPLLKTYEDAGLDEFVIRLVPAGDPVEALRVALDLFTR